VRRGTKELPIRRRSSGTIWHLFNIESSSSQILSHFVAKIVSMVSITVEFAPMKKSAFDYLSVDILYVQFFNEFRSLPEVAFREFQNPPECSGR
jgi:hypothetical protein